MSTIQRDFDRIALVSPDGSLQNNHYHNFLLRYLPLECNQTLEIGCGKGEFSRQLAKRSSRLLALDLSPEMIRIARESSGEFPQIDFQIAEVMSYDLPPEHFDCVASIATLHHLPRREALLKMKAALKPGGMLLLLDLFEPIKWHGHPGSESRHGEGQNGSLSEGIFDALLSGVAVCLSVSLRLVHHGRLLPKREVRNAWAAHAAHDLYPIMKEVRTLCAEILPEATVRKHLLWRYSIIWKKP